MSTERETSGSVRVGRVLGIDVRLHWTFLVLFALVVAANVDAGARSVAAGVLWIAAVFGAVLVHELAHCLVARRRGAVVEDILLTPLGGLSRLHETPKAPADELAIAVVGPLASLSLAVLAAGGGAVFGARLWPPTLLAGSWFARIAWLNVLLGGFNLLPALPMDGGRVLRAALARHRDRRRATEVAVSVARVFAVAMIVAGLAYDPWLAVIGAFVLLGSAAEEQASEADDRHRGDGGAPPPASPPSGQGSPIAR